MIFFFCNIAVYAGDTLLYTNIDQASDLWQQLELASWTWIWSMWSRAWSGLLISILEKLSWFHLTSLIALVLLMRKWIDLFLRKNLLLKCLGWLSVLNWIGALCSYLNCQTVSKKIEPRFVLWNAFLPSLLYISINLPYCHTWNTGVMSGLVLLAATGIVG